MSDPIDWIRRSGARAKGRRPAYFDDPQQDWMMSMLMALVGEVSVLRERLDTVERLLEARDALTRADIESYAPDRAAGHERGVLVQQYIARIMRGLQQEVEAIGSDEPPLEEISRQLQDM